MIAEAKPLPLPFEPEPLSRLRDRYAAAIVKVWHPALIAALADEGMPFDRPTIHREHVFDFESGIRMGISAEELEGEQYLHVSASIHDHGGLSEVEKELLKLPGPPSLARARSFVAMIEQFLPLVTGRWDFYLMGSTSKVFHWRTPPMA